MTDSAVKMRTPRLIKDIRDDAYAKGYIDALRHMTTTLLCAAEISTFRSADFKAGVEYAAKITGNEARDLSGSDRIMEEPQ